MTIRRRFASVPPVMLMTSKSSRTRSYDAMPSRASHHYLLGYPTSKADQMIYDTRAEDYMNDRVTSAGIFSSYAVEEGYDTAKKSRDRDARLLRDATDAISGRRPATKSSSSAAFLGPRRFPRRFGKPNARKNKSSSFYGARLATESKQKPVLSPISVAPQAPSADWRNYARARSASVARSRFDDEDLSLRRPSFQPRAQSVGPSLYRARSLDIMSRRSLPPSPVDAVRESIISTRSQLGLPIRAAYSPVYEDFDTNTVNLPRRRPRILAIRRPFGNYYDRMLRKRGRLHGPQTMEYIPETTFMGTSVSGALSRVGRGNEYSGASLLLSLEGSGLTNDGKRVGFTYTPTPIPLFGSSLGVDERTFGSRMSLQPLDNFITGHVARMGALKNRLNDYLNRDKRRRLQLDMTPLESGPRPMATYIPSRYLDLDFEPPTRELSLSEIERPLTVMRRPGQGQDPMVDVIPLGNIRPRVAANTISLPKTLSGGLNLSMLDKINIKAAIIASKMDADPFKGRRPRSEYAARKYRAMRRSDQEGVYLRSPMTSAYYASNPPLSTPAGGCKTKVLSKVVIRRPGSGSERVVTVPYQTARKRSRFLGKPSPVKYFPSPYDFPDPRLNVPPRGSISLARRKDSDDGVDGGYTERQRATVKIPNYYACGVDPANPPMSDLRRRIRRTLNKTRRH